MDYYETLDEMTRLAGLMSRKLARRCIERDPALVRTTSPHAREYMRLAALLPTLRAETKKAIKP